MSPEYLGLMSLAALFIFIFVGFPISLTLIFLGIVFGYIGFGKVVFYLMTYQVFGTMTETLLAAVPLFLFMGYVLEQTGLMNRLFHGFQLLLAPVRGSLYIVVLAVATLFAAATGIVGAAVTILGVMAAPIMMKSGYSARLSAGSIAAGGTLGMLIPPSVMLVVMGPVVGAPITELFAAAVIPGFLLAILYALYAVGRSYLNPSLGPVLPVDQRAESVGQVVRELFFWHPPAGVPDLRGLGKHSGRSGNADGCRRHGSPGIVDTGRRLSAIDMGESQEGRFFDDSDVQHDPVAGCGLQFLWRRIRSPRHRKHDRPNAARIAVSTDHDPADDPGTGLPPRVAIGMGAHRAHCHSNFHASDP